MNVMTLMSALKNSLIIYHLGIWECDCITIRRSLVGGKASFGDSALEHSRCPRTRVSFLRQEPPAASFLVSKAADEVLPCSAYPVCAKT